MSRWRVCGWLGLSWVAFSMAWASPEERQQLAIDRQAIVLRFAAEEAECRQRFIVTSCVDDVLQRRRAALAIQREHELLLDDAERRARVAERQQAVALKQAEVASRPAAPPVQPVLRQPAAAASASSPAPALEVLPRAAPDRREAQAAARRASAAEQRRIDGELERARIAAREADRAARGKPVVPLPLPAELAGSAPLR